MLLELSKQLIEAEALVDALRSQMEEIIKVFVARCDDAWLPLKKNRVVLSEFFIDGLNDLHIAFDWGEGDRQFLIVPVSLLEKSQAEIANYFLAKAQAAAAFQKQKQQEQAEHDLLVEREQYIRLKKKFEGQ